MLPFRRLRNGSQVARAKPDPLQHRAQSRGRPNRAILEEIDVRQAPRSWQMAAAARLRASSPVNSARVRVSNTCA